MLNTTETNVTLADLGISTPLSWFEATDVMMIALPLEKENVIREIMSMFTDNDEHMASMLDMICLSAKYSKNFRSASLPFRMLETLEYDKQIALIKRSSYAFDILKSKVEVIRITEHDSKVWILFYSRLIPHEILHDVDTPITLDQANNWFEGLKFASPGVFSDFLELISRNTSLFGKLKAQRKVKVRIDSFIQIATDDDLIAKFFELGLEPCFEINHENMTKLLSHNGLLDITSIVPFDSLVEFLAPAIDSEQKWQNFYALVGRWSIESVSDKIQGSATDVERNYFNIRNVLKQVMRSGTEAEINYVRRIDNPPFQQMLAQDFP